jgi:hypothetical protein
VISILEPSGVSRAERAGLKNLNRTISDADVALGPLLTHGRRAMSAPLPGLLSSGN